MTIEGVDYAFSSPSPAGLAAAGKRFAMRYVGPGSASKHLTAAERDQIWAAGLSIVLLVEGATGDILAGYATGRAHAQSAESARLALGAPALPLYFAADRDMTAANMPAINAYLLGAASVIGASRVGIYGEYDVMRWTHDAGTAAWFFQTYAWSGGAWYPGNHVQQYKNTVSLAGGTVDLCRALLPNFGQWPAATTITQEADMTPGEHELLSALAWRMDALRAGVDKVQGGTYAGEKMWVVTQLNALTTKVDGLAAPAAADVVILAAAFKLALQDPTTLTAMAKAVNDDLHARTAE
jgi:Domain of unknown function (DUF1906)